MLSPGGGGADHQLHPPLATRTTRCTWNHHAWHDPHLLVGGLWLVVITVAAVAVLPAAGHGGLGVVGHLVPVPLRPGWLRLNDSKPI
jgi:hypothetical protein